MNIKKKIVSGRKSLNESQQIQIGPQQMMQNRSKSVNSNMQKMQDVFEIKTNQFKFQCGVVMANISSGVDNPFGLSYWANKASNFDEFVSMVQNAVGEELTSSDISRLQSEYNKVA